jgi:hypothetical protein
MNAMSLRCYVKEVLESYRETPGTRDRVRPADRRLAEDLFHRAVPIQNVRAAFLIAAARRTFRDPDLTPLEPIASLHYFLPVLEEVLRQKVDSDYLQHVEERLGATTDAHRFP